MITTVKYSIMTNTVQKRFFSTNLDKLGGAFFFNIDGDNISLKN